MRRAALAAALFAASVPAAAADFTFRVPVNLTDYVQPGSVIGSSQSLVCHIYKVAPGVATDIGQGKTVLAIPASGNLNVTVSVDVNAVAPNHPQDASLYRCWFYVADGVTADSALTGGDLKPKAGTTPVLNVNGSIPK